MQIENQFVVKAPVEAVWSYLLDVERVAPCMPGAELTEVIDENTYKGKAGVKLGPVNMSFSGTVVLQERNQAERRVVMKADGREQRGKGAASALVTSSMEAVDGGTKVDVLAELTITGAIAQYGRGMIQDISQKLAQEFAECLQANIAAEQAAVAGASVGAGVTEAGSAPSSAPVATARPVKGIRLGLWAFWRAIVRSFRRMFGRGDH